MRTTPPLPLPARRALAKLGADIRSARIRRRIPMMLMAERAFISRTTLGKVEKGEPAVSLGVYATVMSLLGMASRLADLADVRSDDVGLSLDEDRLPQRVRLPGSRVSAKASTKPTEPEAD